MSNTPYDDSFRTLLTDCKRLVIPLVNEIFKENHEINEHVELYQNELFITSGTDKKRISDSNFTIGKNSRRYNIECQSSVDGTIIVRVFEYASQIAVITAKTGDMETYFTLPRSGVLYLKCPENTPLEHKIVISTPEGNISYSVPVIKVANYSMEKIIENKLWFLIPFYFFNYKLDELEKNQDKLNEMKNLYSELWKKLDEMVEANIISEYEKLVIKAMSDKVANALTLGYNNVRKGVDDIMGGTVLDYEAKRMYIDATVKALLRNNVSKSNIIEDLEKEFNLTKEAALEAINQARLTLE